MTVRHIVIGGTTAFAAFTTLVGYSVGRNGRQLFPAMSEIQLVAPPPDSSKHTVKDREGDHISNPKKDPFLLPDPANIKKDVEYDPETGKYLVTEKVGDQNIKEPMYLTYDEYLKYTEKQERNNYLKSRSNALQLIEDKGMIPTVDMKNPILDRLFGGSKIEIKPQGNLEVTLGGSSQQINNPNIPVRSRKTGGLDFDMNMNLNVIGKIGDKLQLGIKYNTQTGFDFDNQIKLGWTGDEDDIVKEVALGNVSLPLPTRLISGSQTLFGFKTKLQFGRLTWTSIISQQKSKKESITVKNGSQVQPFEIKSDQYDENRHYFLAQYFRDQYDYALSSLPIIKSVINITRLEVWVTNRNGTTQNVRDVVALADIGEKNPYHYAADPAADEHPSNSSNGLYGALVTSPNSRFINNTVNDLQSSFGLLQGPDFEKTYARRLNTTEYSFNQQLGYISLNNQLNPNEVMAVAFQYEANGKIYQVGEFADQIPSDSSSTAKVLYLKMLKGTTVRVQHPVWNLMMKNIYSLGAYQLSNDGFRLDVYYNDPGAGEKRYMPKGCLQGKQLIKVLNLDNVNTNNDAQPDGLCDFIPGITMIAANGRLIFPVVEPFGNRLREKFEECGSGQQLADQYAYDQLYDSTKFIAQQYPEKNRFTIRGQYKGSNSSSIRLSSSNIPRGSITVTAGGQKLIEDVDFSVDYSLGSVTILNEGVLNSGQEVKVDFENNNQFGFQTRSLLGTRLDFRVNKQINIGATVMNMRERPFTQKVNLGEDPINNTILGADVSYQADAPWLTKALDKLPIYSTKEMSTVSAYAEVAQLIPGHQKAINGEDGQAMVYLDDFEGANSSYSIKEPTINWKLASVPRNAPGPNGEILFSEADLTNDLRNGYNRARLAWYRIDNTFYANGTTTPQVFKSNASLLRDNFVRQVLQSEIFPNRSTNNNIDNNLYPFDLAFYPKERGPYNYEAQTSPSGYSAGINPDGTLKDPASRWGGIMRSLDNTDLQANNTEYIEFWLMNPFSKSPTSTGGQLYINLGNVSEDIMRDSRQQFENGLSDNPDDVDSTTWGNVSRNKPLVLAFDNEPSKRPQQDKGLDGMSSAQENERFSSTFLTNIDAIIPPGTDANQKLKIDPSSDDYKFYLDESLDNEGSILQRYKHFNNTENNSPILSGNGATNAGTSVPDAEDLNKDFTLNESEDYFQYRVDLSPSMNESNSKYIISHIDVPASGNNNNEATTWYQFRIPINEYDNKVGNIPDFKSIQFMRMFLNGFEDSVILRFATLEMVRNQWRTYNLPIDNGGENSPVDPNNLTTFSVTSVSVEENGSKTPVNYIMPPGIQRTQAISSQTNQYVAQNEKAMALNVCGLQDGKSKAVYKNMSIDVRRYKRLKMFVHANRREGDPYPVRNKEVTLFVRLGADFTENYYQYEIPLHMTADNDAYRSDVEADQDSVWNPMNNVDISLDTLIQLKMARNAVPNLPKTAPYSMTLNGRILTIVGNPDLGNMKTMMLGIKNPQKGDANNPLGANDDGLEKCVEVWVNELRLSEFDERGGTAALADVAIKLADLGRLNLSGTMHTRGFGQVDQKLDQRAKDTYYQYAVSSNIEIGKLLPEKAGIRIPFYGGISQNFSMPEFDPYQLDITSKNQVNAVKTTHGADSAKRYQRQIQTINTQRDYNFSGVRFAPKLKAKTPQIWDPANFSFTYSYSQTTYTDPYVESNDLKLYFGQILWSYAPQSKELTPFKKLIKSKSKWLDIIRDFNFNFMPANLAFSTDMSRQFGKIQLRSLGGDDLAVQPTYNKFFKWNRSYALKYNPFKSLSLDYAANNIGRIDEADGEIDTQTEKDEIWNNIKKGGRNTNYSQTFNAAYTIPINKIPLFDFITANVSYNSAYSWLAAPLVRDSATEQMVVNPLGNTVNNSQADRAKVDFNLKRIYDKWGFTKMYSSPNPTLGDKKANQKKKADTRKAREKIQTDIQKLKEKRDKLQEDITQLKLDPSVPDSLKKPRVAQMKKDLKNLKKQLRQKRKDLSNKPMPSEPLISVIMRPLLSLRKISVDYKETKATSLSGFMPSSQILGNNTKLAAPGYDFAFGAQPGDRFFFGADENARTAWLDRAADRGWISSDTILNQKFMQTRQSRLDITASLEPFQDLRVDLTWFRDYTENYSELFKKLSGDGDWQHLTPMTMGSYSVSFVSVKTLFNKIDSAGLSKTYTQFEKNREIISRRLGDGDFYNPSDSTTNPRYANGYGPKAQQVLIPAFLSAYTGKDANKMKLGLFSQIPLPNWKVTYNGLSKIKWLQSAFSSITLTHGYNSTMTVNSYATNLNATFDENGDVRQDSLNGNYYAMYAIPSIVINEQFSPLIGLDLTTKNNITLRFDYRKSRTVTMNFADYQLIENNSMSVTAGLGYTIRGLKLPIKIKGKPVKLDNDLKFRVDVSYRDNEIINHRIDEGSPQITSGSKNIIISPAIDYVINNRINVRLFVDYNRTIPKISTSYPTTNVKGGLTFRVTLAQ